MKLKNILIIQVFLMMMIGFVVAEDSVLDLSLDKATELAVTNSEELAIQKEKIENIQNQYKAIRSSIFPQVTANVDWANYIEAPKMNVGTMSFSLYQDYEVSAGVALKQVLWAFGKVFTAIEIAKESINATELEKNVVKAELVYSVKNVYFSILYADEVIKILNESYTHAVENKKLLDDKFSRGRTSEYNNVKMQADIAGRVPRVLNAKSSYEQLVVVMKDILAVDTNDIKFTTPFVKVFPKYNIEDLKNKLILNDASLKLARANIKIKETTMKYKKVQGYPTLAGFYSFGKSGGGTDILPTDDLKTTSIVGVSLTVSLWDSGKVRNEYEQARHDKNSAEISYKKLEKSLVVELEQACTNYENLKKVYDASLKAEELARLAYKITKENFMSGVASQTTLNDAELQYTSARISRLECLYNINMVILEIEKLTEE